MKNGPPIPFDQWPVETRGPDQPGGLAPVPPAATPPVAVTRGAIDMPNLVAMFGALLALIACFLPLIGVPWFTVSMVNFGGAALAVGPIGGWEGIAAQAGGILLLALPVCAAVTIGTGLARMRRPNTSLWQLSFLSAGFAISIPMAVGIQMGIGLVTDFTRQVLATVNTVLGFLGQLVNVFGYGFGADQSWLGFAASIDPNMTFVFPGVSAWLVPIGFTIAFAAMVYKEYFATGSN